MKDAVVSIIDHLEQDFTDITVAGEQLWEVYGVLQRKVDQVLECINELKLPPVKTDILKNTDAGPGVGSSNAKGMPRCRDG